MRGLYSIVDEVYSLKNEVKVLMLALMVLLVTSPSAYSISNFREYTYGISGEYTGVLEVDVSGKYKSLLTSNKSDLSPGHLQVTYKYWFFLDIKYTRYGLYYLYGYTLENYTIKYKGFNTKYIETINKTLARELGKTYIYRSSEVNPKILLVVSAGFSKIYFSDFKDYRNVTAISLYEDVVCLEFSLYNEIILGDNIYKMLIVTYYDAISHTPLYFYRYRSMSDIYNDTNYIHIKETITDYGIGLGLSHISFSSTKIVYFDNGKTGKIGIITHGEYVKPILKRKNNSLLIEINTTYPYRIVLTLDKKIRLNYSAIKFTIHRLRTADIYISNVITHNSTYNITFNHLILKIIDQSGNTTFIHEITIDEKHYSSYSVILYTLGFNIFAIIIAYRISRLIASIVRQAI